MNTMQELVLSNPDSGIIRAVLADAYNDLGNMDKAEAEFKKAVKLKSDSEIVSLGLFHCLFGQDKKHEAFAEMDRFLEISDCNDYRQIIKEITLEYGSIENYLRALRIKKMAK